MRDPFSLCGCPPDLRAGSRFARLLLILIVGVVALAPAARAQGTSELAGRVQGQAGVPIADARIQVSADGATTFEAFTDSAGQYRKVLPSGRSFVVSVSAHGFVPETRIVDLPAGNTAARADFTLAVRVIPLDPLTVQVEPLSVASATRWIPGSAEKSQLALGLRTEPLGSDLMSELAERQPHVAAVSTPDGPGLSIAGQAPDQTRYTIDGGDAASAVPREAIRSASLLSNTYDVARGGFTGGQVDVRTQRAGNEWGGAIRLAGASSALTFGPPRDFGGSSAADLGGGGAIVRERLFVFGAATLRRSEIESGSIDDLRAADLSRLGIGRAEVERFLAITDPWRPNDVQGREAGFTDFGTALVRLDAVLSPRSALLLRLNTQSSASRLGAGVTAVPGTGSRSRTGGSGFLAQLNSGGERVANELRINWNRQSQRWRGDDPAPVGVVSMIDSASARGLSDLRFAGSGLQPRDSEDSRLDLVDQLVITTPDRSHRFRIGAELGLARHSATAAGDPGLFLFSSLEDLEAGRPALFTRTLGRVAPQASSRRSAIFLDDHWRSGTVHVSYGARAERVWYSADGEADPAVAALFGVRPGWVPSRWRVSPRIGFAIDARMPWSGASGGRSTIQGGVGEFVGTTALRSLAPVLAERGLGSEDLTCIGEAAPTPAWSAYRRDPASIPAACADGSSPLTTRTPRVTVFSPGFVPPRVQRASIDGQGVLPNGVVWSLGASLLRGLNQPTARDLNLSATPAFLNTNEGGRSVFADPAGIDPASGLVAPSASRRFAEYGIVREVSGTGRSRTVQLSATANQTFRPVRGLGWPYAGVNYTWTDARETVGTLSALDHSLSSVGADPSVLEWAPSRYTPRHMVQVYAGALRSRVVSFALFARANSGVPFTPMTAGDVNGDGLPNDRAFVFDPAEPGLEADVRNGMRDLLRSAPPGVRACLSEQRGSIASHNSCRTGWSHAVDLHTSLQLGPRIGTSPHRRLRVWILASNLTAGLDYLLHGEAGLKGWGQAGWVDNRLLSVQGFDPVQRRFRYVVNSDFGRRGSGSAAQPLPFSLRIQARLVLGVDRPLREFEEARNSMGNRTQAFSPGNVRLHIERQLPNLSAEVLALNGPQQLYLTVEQARRLEELARDHRQRAAPMIDSLVALVAIPPGSAPPAPASAAVRVLSREAVAFRRHTVDLVRDVLTPAQWSALPGHLRSTSGEFSPLPPERLTATTSY